MFIYTGETFLLINLEKVAEISPVLFTYRFMDALPTVVGPPLFIVAAI
jgi:hypothetical protein